MAAQEPTAAPTAVPSARPGSDAADTADTADDAGDDSTTDVSNVAAGSAEIPLSKLGVTDVEMTSPSGFLQFRFTVPDNWAINTEGENRLVLAVDYTQNGSEVLEEQGLSALMTTLRVQVDEKLITSLYLPADASGTQELEIPLPAEVFADTKIHSHTVRITLDATEYCLINASVRLIVRAADSKLQLDYQEVAPSFDLAAYPVPFYKHSFDATSDVAYLVLPKVKDEAVLTAAAAVAAGLGRLTNNNITIKYADAEALPKEAEAENMIVIGTPGKNVALDKLYQDGALPTKLTGTKLTYSVKEQNKDVTKDVPASDGILQLIPNPLNENRAILTVTGQTPEAMLKAAQSLTSRSGDTAVVQGPLALISDFKPVDAQPLESLQHLQVSFSELGYGSGDLSITGRGTRFVGINFPVPLDSQVAENAYVHLKFTYSDTIEGARTTVALLLNGTTFGSRLLTDKAEQPGAVNEIMANLPSEAVIPGLNNTLAIVVETQGNWGCYPPSSNALYFSIDPESVISLPLIKSEDTTSATAVTFFPGAFNTTPNLSDVMISLPKTPSIVEFEHAFRTIARLAANTTTASAAGFSPRINIGDIPSGTDLAKYHIVAIGRPTTNPLIKTLNTNLAQPFVQDSDLFNQVLDQATYRMLPNTSVGVLQTLRSPWSPRKMVLVITGSSEAGQLQAAEALFNPGTTPDQLRGDVVFISDDKVAALRSQSQNQGVSISALATRSAEIATATAAVGTPGPTSTRGPSPTPTPLFTYTPSPTVPTAFPTFAPLPPDQGGTGVSIRPMWIDALFATALLMLVGTGFYMAYRTVNERQRKQA